MRVRLGRGRQQQVAAQLQTLAGRGQRSGRLDGLDLAAAQANVDDLAGNQPYPTE
jgi:hypothetical protein